MRYTEKQELSACTHPPRSTSRSRRERIFHTTNKIPPKDGIYGIEPTADQNPNPNSALITPHQVQLGEDNNDP
jgi:hypothetical protein